MSGREAYFLAAVALRMISKHETDFSGSAQFLDKAYDALKIDKDEKTAKKFDELRFLNEKCAHSLSVYYFSRMTNPDSFQDDKFDRLVASLEKVLEPIKYFEPQVSLNSRSAPTLAHVALNTIQAHAIQAYRLSKDQQSPSSIALEPETLNRALRTLEKLSGTSTEKNGRLFKTKLMECYSLVGSLLVRGCEGRTTNDVANAFRGWERTAVTEYDRWRYENLRKLANDLILGK